MVSNLFFYQRRRRLVRVSHRIVFGTLDAVNAALAKRGWQINTSFAERLNLDIRQHVAAVGRRVNTLCKGERIGNPPIRRLLSRGHTSPYTTFDNFFPWRPAWHSPPTCGRRRIPVFLHVVSAVGAPHHPPSRSKA
jgi:hypothetical protein